MMIGAPSQVEWDGNSAKTKIPSKAAHSKLV
jgi:hypothetical protein